MTIYDERGCAVSAWSRFEHILSAMLRKIEQTDEEAVQVWLALIHRWPTRFRRWMCENPEDIPEWMRSRLTAYGWDIAGILEGSECEPTVTCLPREEDQERITEAPPMVHDDDVGRVAIDDITGRRVKRGDVLGEDMVTANGRELGKLWRFVKVSESDVWHGELYKPLIVVEYLLDDPYFRRRFKMPAHIFGLTILDYDEWEGLRDHGSSSV